MIMIISVIIILYGLVDCSAIDDDDDLVIVGSNDKHHITITDKHV